MGKGLLIFRLSSMDLRHRPAESVMLLLAIMAATTTLTLGLVLHGITNRPYQQTRAATEGPDIVATNATTHQGATTYADLAALKALVQDPSVVGHSGPFPTTVTTLRTNGITAGAELEGRGYAPAAVDQPRVDQGSWIKRDGVVVEHSFADALGLHVGDVLTLSNRKFRVVGTAVTAAIPPFPQACSDGCNLNLPQLNSSNTGLIWINAAEVHRLATTAEPVSYILNLKLANPNEVDAFMHRYGSNDPASSAPFMDTWQNISQQDGHLIQGEQMAMLVGSWLLAVLAVASVAVLVGGRIAGQIRRVGLLKAVGATPGLVAVSFLCEYLALALLAAVGGLALGRLAAPLLIDPGAGLLGSAGAPSLTPFDVGLVMLVALAVALAAALVPALRAAHTDTISALANSARLPRRRALLIKISAWLPVPFLLGLRVAARRPRRIVLSAISIGVTVSGVVAVLIAHGRLAATGVSGGLDNPRIDQGNEVLLVTTAMLVSLALVNAIFIARASEQDSRHTSAVIRALGASPQQVTTGMSIAQAIPALAGALVGVPAGIALYASVKHGATMTFPSIGAVISLVVATVAGIAAITVVPVRMAARQPVAEVLQAEAA